MPPEILANTRRTRTIGIATALMCALAGGAVWCLLSLYSRRDLTACAFVVALLVAWALRAHAHAGRPAAAIVAAVCVLIASTYAFYLQAVAGVASLLGLPMLASMRQMGPAMTFDVAWANLDRWDGALILGATAFSIWLVMRKPAREQP